MYLHQVLVCGPCAGDSVTPRGDMIIVRYADDFIVGFQHEHEARHFLNEMPGRLQKLALTLHPEKTKLRCCARQAHCVP